MTSDHNNQTTKLSGFSYSLRNSRAHIGHRFKHGQKDKFKVTPTRKKTTQFWTLLTRPRPALLSSEKQY